MAAAFTLWETERGRDREKAAYKTRWLPPTWWETEPGRDRETAAGQIVFLILPSASDWLSHLNSAVSSPKMEYLL